jgi:hypothetical protein
MLALVIAHGTHKVDLVVAADDLTVSVDEQGGIVIFAAGSKTLE